MPLANFADERFIAAKVSGNKPLVITEVGYHNDVVTNDPHRGISEKAYAMYAPRTVLEAFRDGIVRTYFYQFADPWTDAEAQRIGIQPERELLRAAALGPVAAALVPRAPEPPASGRRRVRAGRLTGRTALWPRGGGPGRAAAAAALCRRLLRPRPLASGERVEPRREGRGHARAGPARGRHGSSRVARAALRPGRLGRREPALDEPAPDPREPRGCPGRPPPDPGRSRAARRRRRPRPRPGPPRPSTDPPATPPPGTPPGSPAPGRPGTSTPGIPGGSTGTAGARTSLRPRAAVSAGRPHSGAPGSQLKRWQRAHGHAARNKPGPQVARHDSGAYGCWSSSGGRAADRCVRANSR